eukprot:TRINITY_DN2038_c0_g1_i1.p1 TRINITY_DN2038_c0_g1~~TRINITY_DN2038_c0_g1_i1.p1  ORF type:complete len:505 (-),score=164.95 TRINITY_DN2038_c0_g1_i1:142-1656(-)
MTKLYFSEGVNPFAVELDQTSEMVNFLIWVHYNNKFVELFDTFFMVMNKKNEQLSFLHIYHHVLLMWSWYAVCKYGGSGGMAWFSAMCNSLIHVLMYSYYLLAAMKIDCPWKKALTKAQMLQFCACMSTSLYSIYSGIYPFYLCLLNVWVMVNMLVLFGNFYRKRYAKTKHTRGKDEKIDTVQNKTTVAQVAAHTTGLDAASQASKDVQKMASDYSKHTESSPLWKPMLAVLLYQGAQEWYASSWTVKHTVEFWSGATIYKPAIASVLYLLMIFCGKKFMENREPSPALRKYIYAYNLYQVCLNAWCVYVFIKEMTKLYFSEGVNPFAVELDQTSEMVNFLIWVHYNNKFVELFDTFFMVMNKKNEQLSFLHIYHHVLLMWSWYAVCKYGGSGGMAWFSAMCNSLIHVLMYSYYLLAAMKIDCPWKKALTKAQMLQFCACMSTSLYSIYSGIYPFYLCLLNVWVMVNMLVLFGNFYRKRYAKTKHTKPADPVGSTASSPKMKVQ